MTQVKNEDDSKNDEAGKMFVGGLSWETTQEKLEEYFSKYGEVIDSVVMKNTETGKSRGFGFVTFKDPGCVAKVLCGGPHELDGRTIDPKVCSTRESQKNKNSGQHPKVFLGGLPLNCTETDLRSFFSRYGTVVEVVLMYDQEKKKPRGFGFLSFESEESVKQVCAEHFVKINGKKIEVKPCVPREKKQPNQQTDTNTGAQWTGPQMGPGGWGPNMGPQGPMPGPPMNNGMMGPPGGFQGWGGPAPYGPQGWAPQPGPYGPGNAGWGWGPGYGPPYGGPPGPQYGHPGYGYGYNYGPGYGGPGPMGGPTPPNPPVAPGPEQQGPAQQGPSNNNNSNNTNNSNAGAPSGPATTGMGTNYAQEQSNYGPVRPGFGPGYGGGPNFNPGGNYPAPGNFGNQANTTGGTGPAQTYHPYRR